MDNAEQPIVAVDPTVDDVKPRGDFEHRAKDGSLHFFNTPMERAEFVADENNPDNR